MAQDKVKLITDDLLSEWIDKHDRLKELLDIKRNAQAILDDDTVNSWGEGVVKKLSEEEVKNAADAFNEAQKETDEIINNL